MRPSHLLVLSGILLLCLTACPMQEDCIAVTVTNLTDQRIAIAATECWALVITIQPGKSAQIFVLPGETVKATEEDYGAEYFHIFARDNDLWEIK